MTRVSAIGQRDALLLALRRMERILEVGAWPSGLELTPSDRAIITANLARNREVLEELEDDEGLPDMANEDFLEILAGHRARLPSSWRPDPDDL